MKLEGSFTVEASLVFPIISFILVTSLFICIYTHDMVCLKHIGHMAILEGSQLSNSRDYFGRIEEGLYFKQGENEKLEKAMTMFITDQANRVLFMNNKNMVVDVDIKPNGFSKEINVVISKGFKMLFDFNIHLIKIQITGKGKLQQPTSFIRNIDFIDDVTDDFVPIKPLKDRYNGFIKKLEDIINDWI